MKIVAKVPKNTVPYRCGERLMACEVTDKFEFVHAAEFFKTKEEAKERTAEHPEYKWNGSEVNRTLHLKYIGLDSWSRYVYEDENGKIWKLLDCCSPRKVCEERGDTPYSSCGNTLDGEPDCPMRDNIKVIFEEE